MINLGPGCRCRHTTCIQHDDKLRGLGTGVVTLPVYRIPHEDDKLGVWVHVSSHYLSTGFLMKTINLGSGYRCRHTTCLQHANKLGVWVQVLSHNLSTRFLMVTINLGSGYRCRHTTCLQHANKLGVWVQVLSHYLSTRLIMVTINLGSGYRCRHTTCLQDSS